MLVKYGLKTPTKSDNNSNENKTLKILWDFEIKTDHSNPWLLPDQVVINKMQQTSHPVVVTISADRWVEIKLIEKLKIYLDHAGMFKQMKMIIIPIIIVAPGTILKKLEKPN